MYITRSRLTAALLSSVVMLTASVGATAAATAPSSVDPAQLQRRLQEPRSAHKSVDIVIPGDENMGLIDESEDKLFTLRGVKITGSTVYAADELNFAYADYIGQKVSFADLRRIANSITVKYRRDGYILSRVIVPPQTIGDDGMVTMRAIEGFIDKVKFDGEIIGDKKLLDAFAAKITKTRPITASALERYMLLIDDLPGVTARSVITPSDVTPQAATLVISLGNERIEGSIAVDNRGNRFLGPYQFSAVAAINSGFGMYDRNSLRVVSSSDLDELLYGEFMHESQIGSEGMRLNFRAASTYTNPGGRLSPLDIEGESHLVEMSFSYPHIRSRTQNLDYVGSMRLQNSSTDILGSNLFKDKVRVVTFGIQYDSNDDFGGVNLLDASISQGLDFLGATDDGAGRSRSTAKHGFTSFSANLSRLQNIGGDFSLLFATRGQFSADSLLSSEQFAIGGAQFGRGYDGAEITGDSGIAGSIEVRYAGFPSSDWIDSYQPYAFYDIGAVWTNDLAVGDVKRESLASAGVGVRFNLANQISGGAELAIPLTHQIASELDDNPRVFFNLLKRF